MLNKGVLNISQSLIMWKPGANGSNIKQEEPFMNIIVSKNK